MLYVVPKRVGKGVIIRGDVELDSPEIATLPPGTALTVYRSKRCEAEHCNVNYWFLVYSCLMLTCCSLSLSQHFRLAAR